MYTLRLRKIPTGAGNASTLKRNGQHAVATAEATSEVDGSDYAVTPDPRSRWRRGIVGWAGSGTSLTEVSANKAVSLRAVRVAAW